MPDTPRITWMEQLHLVAIEGSTVKIEGRSGRKRYVAVTPRHEFRRYIETAIRQLDEYERAERERGVVLPFERSG